MIEIANSGIDAFDRYLLDSQSNSTEAMSRSPRPLALDLGTLEI
jgi:hypothetical protein